MNFLKLKLIDKFKKVLLPSSREFKDKRPNKETKKAIEEFNSGNPKSFDSIEDLFKDLND